MTIERHLRFWLIGLAVFLAVLFLLHDVLLPFVAGMAVAYLLDPICDRLEGWGLSRTLATTVLTAAFLILSLAAITLLVPVLAGQAVSFAKRVPGYVATLPGQVAQLLAVVEARVDPAVLEQIESAIKGSAERMVTWATGLVGQLIQHAVLPGHPATAITPHPVRHAILDARRTQDPGTTEFRHNAAGGMFRVISDESHRPQFVRCAATGSHSILPLVLIIIALLKKPSMSFSTSCK